MLGDHIRALKDGRWLHGIDLGDQRVLFLAEAPGLAPGDRLRRVYRPEFTAGASKVELVVHRGPVYAAKAVVARAWSRFMDPSVVSMFRDSEAFAAWCKVGRLPEPLGVEAAPAQAAPTAGTRGAPAPQAATAPAAGKASRARVAPARKPAGKPARKAAPKPARKAAGKAAGRAARKTVGTAGSRPAPKARPTAGKGGARKPAGKAAGRGVARAAPRKPAAKKKGRR